MLAVAILFSLYRLPTLFRVISPLSLQVALTAIALSKDNKFHSRAKHIDLRHHFIREAVDEGKINVQYIPTAENVSDIFTKALPRPKFKFFIEKLGLALVMEEGKDKMSR